MECQHADDENRVSLAFNLDFSRADNGIVGGAVKPREPTPRPICQSVAGVVAIFDLFLVTKLAEVRRGRGQIRCGVFMPLVNIAFFALAIFLNSWNSAFMYRIRYSFGKEAKQG